MEENLCTDLAFNPTGELHCDNPDEIYCKKVGHPLIPSSRANNKELTFSWFGCQFCELVLMISWCKMKHIMNPQQLDYQFHLWLFDTRESAAVMKTLKFNQSRLNGCNWWNNWCCICCFVTWVDLITQRQKTQSWEFLSIASVMPTKELVLKFK